MGFVKTLLYIILALSSIGIIIVVLMQKTAAGGLGALAGMETESHFGKNQKRSFDGRMRLLTKIGATAMILLSFALCIVERYS